MEQHSFHQAKPPAKRVKLDSSNQEKADQDRPNDDRSISLMSVSLVSDSSIQVHTGHGDMSIEDQSQPSFYNDFKIERCNDTLRGSLPRPYDTVELLKEDLSRIGPNFTCYTPGIRNEMLPARHANFNIQEIGTFNSIPETRSMKTSSSDGDIKYGNEGEVALNKPLNSTLNSQGKPASQFDLRERAARERLNFDNTANWKLGHWYGL